MIDVGTFSEWILAKARKEHGVASERDNVRDVRAAVEAAIRDGKDEVHVTCTLRGETGPVRIDERFTRTAAENLFARTHVPAERSTARPEPEREEEPPPESDGSRERRERAASDASVQRTAYVITALIFLVVLVIAGFAIVAREHEHHETHREKRETEH